MPLLAQRGCAVRRRTVNRGDGGRIPPVPPAVVPKPGTCRSFANTINALLNVEVSRLAGKKEEVCAFRKKRELLLLLSI